MKPYADTNFFTRFYLELPESAAVGRLIRQGREGHADLLPVTWLHRIELCNALQLHVFQGKHTGHKRVTPEQVGAAWITFQAEVGKRTRPATVAMEDLRDQSEQLSFRYTARFGFRSYDVVHVASALLLKCDTFWSFDTKACRLAALEGLKLAK